MPLLDVTPGFVAQLRDKVTGARRWHFANDVRKVLSIAFSTACEGGLALTNPVKETRRAKRPKDTPRQNRPWTEREYIVIMHRAPLHLRLPIALAMHLGIRMGDILSLPKTARRGMWFSLTTEKTNEYAEMPIPRPLVAILKECTQHNAITLCANSRGRPWTRDGFKTSWGKFRDELEAEGVIGPGITFHGLRHTAATGIIEAGFDDRDVSAVLTHSVSMARHYSREADKKKRRKAVVEAFDPLRRSRRRRTQ